MKLVLKNAQLLGDTLMMTCAVRDLKNQYPDYQIRVDTNYPAIWDNNPYIEDFDGFDLSLNIGPRTITQGSKTNGLHFSNGFRICLEEKLEIKIKQGALNADLHLSEFEKKNKLVYGHYWVIDIDCGPYDAKRWKNEYWQEVVNRLPWITFVQVGIPKRNHYKLKGDNVIDFVGKTENLRDLFRLVYHSQGCLGLVSSLNHTAGAFRKPSVIVAGAREPVAFEAYQWSRYLHNIGSMKCANPYACWRCKMDACKNHSNGIPKCLDMIKPDDVIRAIESYYEGEVLEKPKTSSVCTVEGKKPVLKIVCNAHLYGGAEKSTVEICKMALDRGWDVELVPRKIVCEPMKKELAYVKIHNKITSPCDVLLLYASDMIWDFNKPEFDIMNKVKAKRKVMTLTFHVGQAGKAEWTKNWDLYLFLCSALKDGFLKNHPEAKTKVLAPPVDIEDLLKIRPKYESTPFHIVRHSSQGDSKYSKDLVDIVKACPKVKFSFMPSPSFMPGLPNVIKNKYNEMPVIDFLKRANCYWYLLPEGYTDQGPRTIVEAMACGLPVIAENRDGAKDRVTEDTGWLINNHEEAIDIINNLSSEILRVKGKKARKRAEKEFRKENWIESILDLSRGNQWQNC